MTVAEQSRDAIARVDTSFDLDVIRALDLARFPQFVVWRPECRGDKWTKVPVNARTGNLASVTDPSTWCDLDTAASYARAHRYGIGFVFVSDPYTGVDLDHCVDSRTGAIAAWARSILLRLCSYSEISPSGGGVKIIIAASLRSRDGRRRGPVEIYSRRRFFTLTGRRVDGTPFEIQPRQAELDALVGTLWPPQPMVKVVRRQIAPTLNDAALIDRAMHAKNGAKFARLWRGEWGGLYPSQSEADAALAAILAHWTGGDPVRVEQLFRQSGLCREKWLSRADYRERTLARVLH